MKKVYVSKDMPELKVVNTETGEVVSGVAKVSCDSIDEFIMCFLSSVPEVCKLDGNTIKVLMWCWKLSSFNPSMPDANTIVNDRFFKERIREGGCDFCDSVINKSICILNGKGFLIRRCKGNYYLNPKYFFKGTLSDRSRLECRVSYGR